MSLTFAELIEANASRVGRWHTHGGINEWSPLEWSGAVAGEAGEVVHALLRMFGAVGEACNAAKKLKRLESQIASINTEPGRHFADAESARQQVGKETADTIIYGVLLAQRCGIDIEATIIEVFNQKSAEYGFPERIGVLDPSKLVKDCTEAELNAVEIAAVRSALDAHFSKSSAEPAPTESDLEQRAEAFAQQVSTERRVNCDLYLGAQVYPTVTAIVKAAYLAGARGVTREPVLSCREPAPDKSGRQCDKRKGHNGNHWTYGGNTLEWSSALPEPIAPPTAPPTAPTESGTRAREFRMRWKRLGAHIHCRVFAGRLNGASAFLGELKMDDAEWIEFQHINTNRHPHVEFEEDEPTPQRLTPATDL